MIISGELFLIFHFSGIKQYLSLCNWLISLNINLLGPSVLWYKSECPSFLRLSNVLLCIYTTFYLLIHQWTTVNNAAVHLGLQLSVQVPAFISFRCIARSETAGLRGTSIFNFLRNHYSVFKNGCAILDFHLE